MGKPLLHVSAPNAHESKEGRSQAQVCSPEYTDPTKTVRCIIQNLEQKF